MERLATGLMSNQAKKSRRALGRCAGRSGGSGRRGGVVEEWWGEEGGGEEEGKQKHCSPNRRLFARRFFADD